jgi:hypothetical protein
VSILKPFIFSPIFYVLNLLRFSYLGNEEATRAAFDEEGYYRTGDMADLENGELLLHGRERDDCKYFQIPILGFVFETLSLLFSSFRHHFWRLSLFRPQGGTLLDGAALYC